MKLSEKLNQLTESNRRNDERVKTFVEAQKRPCDAPKEKPKNDAPEDAKPATEARS